MSLSGRAVCLLLLVSTHPAMLAQTQVYRCGPDGREYSSTPCPGGKSVDVDDARSAEQRRQTREAARNDAALADKLAAERRARDAESVAGAGRLSAAAPLPAKTASRPAGTKPKKRRHAAPVDPNLSPPMRGAKPKH